jgi:uncharacterized protein (TIGR00297 family)
VTRFRRVAPGTSGAVSVEGTLAGIVGAALLTGAAIALGLMPPRASGGVIVAATAAAFVESVLGATVEARGWIDNDALNFINALIGAALAVALWLVIGR